MLSISQKESILRKAGVPVAPFPVRRLPVQERYRERNVHVPPEELEADREHAAAVRAWRQKLEACYADYMAWRESEGGASGPAPLAMSHGYEAQR